MIEYNQIPKHTFESQPKRIRTYSADNSEYLSTHPFSSIVSIDVEKLYVNDSSIEANCSKTISSEDEIQIPKRNPLLELPPKSYSSEGTPILCNELKKVENINSKLETTKEDLEEKEEAGAYCGENNISNGENNLKWSFSNDISKENKDSMYESSYNHAKGDRVRTTMVKRNNYFTDKFGNGSKKDLTIKINPVKISDERCLNFKYSMERNLSRKQTEKDQSNQRSKSAKGHNLSKDCKSEGTTHDDASPPPDIFVPKSPEEVTYYKSRVKMDKTNTVKLDTLNGWSWYGDSIRETTFENKNIKQTRCYYIGIKRKSTYIFSHDIVLIHPPKGGKERPWVARIASLWSDQTNNDTKPQKGVLRNYRASMMMTVYWYYRPENIESYTYVPTEMEVYESKHYDENTIACIIDRAFVLNYHSYCRFSALKQFYREASESYQDMTPRRIVPSLPRKDLSFPPEDTDISLVFFCRSAYNFNTGKISINH